MISEPTETVADALLTLLGEHGIEYLFANAGTDAAPLSEAYAKAAATGRGPVPIPVVVPHEMAAMSLAHGYAMVAHRPAAVFVHVTVGTANAALGVMNASRQQVPVVVLSGRTPVLEHGAVGSRDLYIHWAQESYDQAGMIREYTRWDYELRDARQLAEVVERALAMATSVPQGPSYLSFPRELLAGPSNRGTEQPRSRLDAGSKHTAEPAAIARVAELLASADAPLIIANTMGRDPAAVSSLVTLAECAAIGVVEVFRERLNFPASHPHHMGFDHTPLMDAADLLIVIEADVPWLPGSGPQPDTQVVHIGVDPLHSGYPMRSFPIDVALRGDPRLIVEALTDAVGPLLVGHEKRLADRRQRLAAVHSTRLEEAQRLADDAADRRPIDPLWVSRCIGDALESDGLIVNEYDVLSDQIGLDRPGSFFSSSSVSGLGWGFGAALGAKLAAPNRTVVCGLGDGAYLFSNPVACHMVATRLEVPILVVVFNNARWNAVSESVRRLAPQGWAQRSGSFPLTDLGPSPDYAAIAAACGAYGEKVESPGEVPEAIQRALRQVRTHNRLALLDVRCA